MQFELRDSEHLKSTKTDYNGLSESVKQPHLSQDTLHPTPLPLHTRRRATSPPRRGWGILGLRSFTTRRYSRTIAWLQKNSFHGWRMGMLAGSCLSAFVLFCNTLLVIVGCSVNSGFRGGLSTLRVGGTSDISWSSTVAHLLINACSTSLLAASNYTMQVLSSPTREEIDREHGKGRWLDVGQLSFRNLRAIPWRRLNTCMILALSSIPLHIFYNAAIFQVTVPESYDVATVEFQSPEWYSLYGNTVEYQIMTNKKWLDIYSARYVSGHGDLILVIDQLAWNVSHKLDLLVPQERLVKTGTTVSVLTARSNDWIDYLETDSRSNDSWPASAHVVNAFSKKVTPRSRLELRLPFMLIVILFNALKLSVMVWTLMNDKSDYLVILGDVISSFLKRPDSTTADRCTLGKEEMLYTLGLSSYHNLPEEDSESIALRIQGQWLPQRRRYFANVGRDRRVFYMVLLTGLPIVAILFPMFTLTRSDQTGRVNAWGTSSQDFLSTGAGDFVDSLLVNAPQFVLSWGYIILNGTCTSMAAAQEWNNIGRFRKGLRVSKPLEEQRSTYFLQLPYRWALPLMAMSAVLHWLMSQSFFLVRIQEGGYNDAASGVGMSYLSFLILILAIFTLLCAIGLVGDRRMQQKMPLAASCSLVVSAACHPPEDDKDAHLKKAKWGVVEKSPGSGYTHCSITAKDIRKPNIGQKFRSPGEAILRCAIVDWNAEQQHH